jgi:hypothetical protein
LLMLYPAYGTVSCHEVCRYAERFDEMRVTLADDVPTTSDLDIFDEVWELPAPEQLAEAHDRLRRWCDKNRPDGIFLQSERGLLLGSLIVREFGLRGPSLEAVHLCSNKYLQRQALAKAGIGNPLFTLGQNAADVRRFARDSGYPLVLKCVISTMSRLVTLIKAEDQIDSAVAHMLQSISVSLDVARLRSFGLTARVDLGCDPGKQFLIESFMDGDMVETDGLVLGDLPYTFGVSEQIQSVDPPFFIESYLLPAECTPNTPVEQVSDAVLKALGLRDSAFSTEMRVKDGVVRIIEVNGRLGWDEGFGDLFKVRTHQDRIAQAFQMALSQKTEVIKDISRCAALAYRPCYYNGVVDELPTKEELRHLSNSEITLGLATNRGARFLAPPHPEVYPHVAWALAVHPTSSRAANEKAREALDRLHIVINKE